MQTIYTKRKNILLNVFVIAFFLLTSFVGNAQVGIGTTTPNSTFEVNGSNGQTITTVTASTTLNATHSIVVCNNGSTAITITLPTAVGITGRIYTIKRTNSSTALVTIATTSSQYIDGATTYLLTNIREAVTVVSDGANWKRTSTNDSNNVQYPIGQISYFDTSGFFYNISAISDGNTNYFVCSPATTFSGNSEFDNGGSNNGRLRYLGIIPKFFHIACTISVYPNSTANDNYVFAVSKNGVAIPESRVMQKLTTGNTMSTAMHVAVYLSYGDYLELSVGNLTSTRDIWVRSLNLFALGMYMN